MGDVSADDVHTDGVDTAGSAGDGALADGVHLVLARRDGTLVASLAGELDLANAAEAGARLTELAGHEDALVVVLDGLAFVDSTGLRVLDGLPAAARAAGCAVHYVVGADGPARRVLALTGLDLALRVHPTVEEALAAR